MNSLFSFDNKMESRKESRTMLHLSILSYYFGIDLPDFNVVKLSSDGKRGVGSFNGSTPRNSFSSFEPETALETAVYGTSLEQLSSICRTTIEHVSSICR